jgi:glycosyltransferase involved in cell wall biosynthesis
MHIALVAPLHEHIPPLRYGGVERIVSFLAEELVRLGHQVDLYACGGSMTTAKLVECWPRSFREDGIGFLNDEVKGPYGQQLQRVFSDLDNYDVIHVHHGTKPFHYDIMNTRGPIVWTDHGLLDLPGKADVLRHLHRRCSVKITAISGSQRRALPADIPCYGIVHHGIPKDLLSPSQPDHQKYLTFLGRVVPEKGLEDAVEIARRAGLLLKVAAKIDGVFQEYYEKEVEPRFRENDVDFIGEISDKEKIPFLSGAVAMLFPIDWEEPFGVVLIEALACGTPVIAYRRGAVDEIITDGIDGFKVRGVHEAVESIDKLRDINRRTVRQVFEEKFTARQMAEGYLEVYKRAARDWKKECVNELRP